MSLSILIPFLQNIDCIGCVMVSVVTTVLDCGFKPRSGQTKDYEIGIAASLPCTQHEGVRTKTGWLRMRIMCPSGVTCLPTDCCFS